MFSSATVILFGGTVGALAYLESSAADADKLLEEISLFYKILCTILNRWVAGRRWSLVTAHKELNCANNHRVSWEVDPFTAEPSDESETMADGSTEA